MPKKMTTEEFIEKAKAVHGDVYDYSEVNYTNNKTPVVIICRVHGPFKQVPTNHLKGCGCKNCYQEKIGGHLRKSNEDFINEAKVVHSNKYNYDKTEYVDNKQKVVITCPVHGDFHQEAKSHLRGAGCPMCANEKASKDLLSNTKDFITKANKVHEGKYSYEEVGYKSAKEKVTITCPKHGNFSQSPNQHLNGQGCAECKKDKLKAGPGRWSYSEWEKAGKVSDGFEGYSLYVVKCTGNGESFIKVGKTFLNISKRFTGDKLPYKYTVVTQVYYNAYAISQLEKKIHKELKEYNYKPKRSFKGDSECFSLEALEKAVSMAED